MKNTKQKEVWKIYPKHPFIEASNLGRIRTKDRYVTVKGRGKRLIKGRVLKQHLLPCGYMYVSFTVNGKSFCLRVHRIVATCFIPNPNNYPEVNHIDNDRTNNAVSNLEWCTRQYNIAYREKYGKSAAEVLGRPVFAVELNTGKVLSFKSQSEAAHQLGINLGNINRVVKGELNSAGGYWFTEDESEITEEKIREIKGGMRLCPVFAVNLETFEVTCFESQSEASRQLGIANSSVSGVVKGDLNQVAGVWFTEDESEITEEKIREIKDNMYFLGGVVVINLDDFKVIYFKSQAEAARQLGISASGINMVINGLRNKIKECWFCYADENATEKIRDKFCDEIAEKAEKLMIERKQEA